MTHDVCRDGAAAFPQSPDDLWITETGELLIARSDQRAPAIEPRNGVAALLDAMLPPEGSDDPDRLVPVALRGLPSRLRATGHDAGPQDRRDLMSILSWHLNGDPREVIQQLARRVAAPQAVAPAAPAVADDWELFKAPPDSQPAPRVTDTAPKSAVLRQPRPTEHPPPLEPPARARAATALALLALAFLFIGIGSASYWLFRKHGADVASEQAVTADAAPTADAASTADASSVPAPGATDSAAPSIPEQPRPLILDVRDGAFSPAFAASGRELFFHAGRAAAGRLHVAALDDRGEVGRVSAVRDDGARDYHPRVSPDGRWIAFDSDRDGERGVYIASRDGANLARVSGAGYAAVPSWSPDMKWLAFIRAEPRRPRVWNLWLRDMSTGALQRHTAFRSGQVWGASWFPDGRAICFSHDEQLIISHLDAREDIIIETPRRGHLVRTPAVSPDGRHVIFQVYKDGAWLLDVQTRAMRRILDDPTAEEFAWSPDGRVAYHSRRDGEWKIWMLTVK